MSTEKGARTRSKVFIVNGYHPEPLLGANDAQSLGFITFNNDGKDPDHRQVPERCVKAISEEGNHNIPEKLRTNLHVKIETAPQTSAKISDTGRKKIDKLIDKYKGLVFKEDGIGKMKCDPIHLDYDPAHKPTQPRFHNVPLHYQKEVSDHLDFLRCQGIIKDVDPKKSYDCVMNVVITDKKNGSIRMNIDNTPRNPGMKRTQYHIQTPQEIRHELKEAKFFTEMDMGYGYHQLEIDEETKDKAIFQTHEGVHRMERLYFGPTSATGIFHNEVRTALTGLKSTTNIHDNLLVWGIDEEDHFRNLADCLERCKDKGISLKLSKSTFGMSSIKWFGRLFTTQGVTADQSKIESIIKEGRPKSLEDVRSFLMACQFNAKFLFDHPNVKESYEEITSPLRSLLKNNSRFTWGSSQEKSYRKLLQIMKSPATLQPFDVKKPTWFVADASEEGIQASIYQKKGNDTWIPIDHCSRGLTPAEANYSPIERESLAQSWGMNEFRFYLVGGNFTAWTDHEPVISIYNNSNKRTSKRISSHRDNVHDLCFTMRYLKGRHMPCDYGSRHPNTIQHLTAEEQDNLGFDMGKTIYVRRITLGDSPDAIKVRDVVQAAHNDRIYQRICSAVKKGSPPKGIPAPFSKVYGELCVADNILLKGDKIVMPDAEFFPGSGNIRRHVIDTAHDGHPGISSMKRRLRSRVWFPGMDQEITATVEGCLPCQASTPKIQRDPLVPSTPPEEPWQKLGADHWGPTPDGKYLMVVIDMLSKYPEVVVVNSTNGDTNVKILDDIFSRHGFPQSLRTDNGPPWNGKECHSMQKYLKWCGIDHEPTISAYDPEANGLAESYMKVCQKIYHTALIENKNPKAEIKIWLRVNRSTPHPSTGKIPAEILFNRRFHNRLPSIINTPSDRKDIEEARLHEIAMKKKQKDYKDKKAYVKPHNIQEGDTVLLQQKKSKQNPPFDPQHYTVINVQGHQIEASRDGKTKVRDAKMWKKVKLKPKTDYDNVRETRRKLQEDEEDEEITFNHQHSLSNEPALVHEDVRSATTTEEEDSNEQDEDRIIPEPSPEQNRPLRRSTRTRKPPKYLEDFTGQRSGSL